MTDEEKKAIEYWKTHMKIPHWNTHLDSEYYMKILLELIEKQQKEIEEHKECERLSKRQLEKQKNDLERLEIEIEELKEDSCCMTNCVRRDKEKLFLEDKIKEFLTTITKEDLEKGWKE